MSPSDIAQLPPFSIVLHRSPNDTNSVKQLPYYLKTTLLLYADKNRFFDIFPWPNVLSSVVYAY